MIATSNHQCVRVIIDELRYMEPSGSKSLIRVHAMEETLHVRFAGGVHYSVRRRLAMLEPKRAKQTMGMERPRKQSIYMLTRDIESVVESCTGTSSMIQICCSECKRNIWPATTQEEIYMKEETQVTYGRVRNEG